MACLDTDILVGLLRGEPEAIAKISTLETTETISTTPINATELFKGAYRSKYSQENVKLVHELIDNLKLLEFDRNSAKSSGRIIEELRKDGKEIGDMDSMIGGIVLANAETLITRNLEHFNRIPGLRTEKW